MRCRICLHIFTQTWGPAPRHSIQLQLSLSTNESEADQFFFSICINPPRHNIILEIIVLNIATHYQLDRNKWACFAVFLNHAELVGMFTFT